MFRFGRFPGYSVERPALMQGRNGYWIDKQEAKNSTCSVTTVSVCLSETLGIGGNATALTRSQVWDDRPIV